jgi:hypothetical protein
MEWKEIGFMQISPLFVLNKAKLKLNKIVTPATVLCFRILYCIYTTFVVHSSSCLRGVLPKSGLSDPNDLLIYDAPSQDKFRAGRILLNGSYWGCGRIFTYTTMVNYCKN